MHVTENDIAEERDLKKVVDGDWDRGYVFVRLPGSNPVRIPEFTKAENKFIVCAKSAELGWSLNFQQVADEANQVSLGQ